MALKSVTDLPNIILGIEFGLGFEVMIQRQLQVEFYGPEDGSSITAGLLTLRNEFTAPMTRSGMLPTSWQIFTTLLFAQRNP
jgi:hypothetical protein